MRCRCHRPPLSLLGGRAFNTGRAFTICFGFRSVSRALCQGYPAKEL